MNLKNLINSRIIKRRFVLIIFLVVHSGLFAQTDNETVNGTITGEDGMPIPGVSVLVLKEGTPIGAITDFDGQYEINAKIGDRLVFSYVGMTTKTVTVTSKQLNVTLSEELSELDEVVVIGYGSVKKKELTGAVARIDSEDIANQVTSDIGNAIQGRISGVSVVSSGEPGEAAQIQIRGITSLTGDNTPLFVVDGIAQESNPNIAPNEIESIDVLKDAASTAVYGVRGAAGVILITTKKGDVGNMRVNINATTGFSTIGDGIELLDAKEQTYINMLQIRNTTGTLDDLQTLTTLSNNPDNFQNDTDISRFLFIDDALTQNYTLNLNGGSEALKYSFNTGFFDSKGIIAGNNFNRFNLRTNATYKKNRLSFNVGVGTVKQTSDRGAAGILAQLVRYQPTLGFNDPNAGEILEIENSPGDINLFTNIIDAITQKAQNKFSRNFGNINFGYDITDNLTFNTNIGYSDFYSTFSFLLPGKTTINISQPEDSPTRVSYRVGGITENFNERTSVNWDAGLTFKKELLEGHNLTLTAVMAREIYKGRFLEARKSILETDFANDIPVLNNANGETFVDSGDNNQSFTRQLVGYLARVQYDYKGKYLLTSSIRRDGSSRFATQNRWGIFPSVAAAWNISDENFFERLNTKINALKLRLSWGTVGNENIGNYLFAAPVTSGISYSFGGTQVAPGIIQNQFANPDVGWETSKQVNIGLDFAMLKNRLTLSAEYYRTNKEDMLFPVTLPNSTGVYDPSSGFGNGANVSVRDFNDLNTVIFNVGNMINTGFELAVGYRGRIKQLRYRMNGTFTANQNEITKVFDDNPQPILTPDLGVVNGAQTPNERITHFAVGREAGAFFLFPTDGIFRTLEEVDAYNNAITGANVVLGDLKYIDSNDDGVINDTDKVYKGSGLPDFEIGYNMRLDYKNFDFSMDWFASYGQEVINGARATAFFFNRSKELLDSYSAVNPNGSIPVVNNNNANYAANTDLFVEDGSYVRLRNVTLGYRLPKKIVDRIGANRIRFYFTGQNLLTLTEYSGFDPEIGGNVFARGLDKGTYPLTRTYLFGLNLNF